MPGTLPDLRLEVKEELLRILDYWMNYAVDKDGDGFYGVVNGDNIPDTHAAKGIVLTSRILWTFSAAQQLFPDPGYPPVATRAFDYLIKYFIDDKYGGVYWSVNADGSPKETKKQLYGHAFAIYGLSEYHKISRDGAALNAAKNLFLQVVDRAYDKLNGGYIEAFERDWSNTDDYILSQGENRKSMNTHLHILEAFTNLYRVWKHQSVQYHLKHSIEMMLNHLIDPETNRLTLFFTDEWKHTSTLISYGHDIEASWLLCEAAEVLGDHSLTKRCKSTAIQMAKAACDGLAPDGALYYELEPGTNQLNTTKQWWPQTEALVGFFNAWQLTGKVNFLEKADKTWEFIKKYLIDYKNGEWFVGVDANNKVLSHEKITFWKCPYHNSRACMEIWLRLGKGAGG